MVALENVVTQRELCIQELREEVSDGRSSRSNWAASGNKHLGTKHLPGLINQKPKTADREDGTQSCARHSLATSVGTVPQ